MSAMCTEFANDGCRYRAHCLMCGILPEADALGV